MSGEIIHLNKKRTIRLKDPKLRRIRTALRTLLVREASKRINDLIKEQGRLIKNRSSDDEEYYMLDSILEEQKNKLRRQRKASICSCATCSDMKEDHVFSPVSHEWYCEKCYARLEKGDYFKNYHNQSRFE
ncbi:hypothetical protein LCGC14_1416430 [marine sediment metagenome]|uniref:Uncharacterized protein n=1 Tax=marine sediment metagenome TaxID=412755 RepID=A0A0F9JT47_9ZZZZ